MMLKNIFIVLLILVPSLVQALDTTNPYTLMEDAAQKLSRDSKTSNPEFKLTPIIYGLSFKRSYYLLYKLNMQELWYETPITKA